MPSGRTHDEITLWSLPWVAVITWVGTRNSHLTLFVAGGFLFSGLMFGPDLDIYSQQFLRWGWLRWIWLPYQKSLHHRSFLSHGPVIGTVLRVVYLMTWSGMVAIAVWLVMHLIGVMPWTVEMMVQWLARSLRNHYPDLIALLIGLELGAMSHSLSDWGGSFCKQIKSRGWIGVLLKSVTSQLTKRKSRKPKKSPNQSNQLRKPQPPSNRRHSTRKKSPAPKRTNKMLVKCQ